MSEPTNETRAEQGAIALGAYTALPGCDNGDARDNLVDLLTNLMHWAEREDDAIIFDFVLLDAKMHFEAEAEGKVCDPAPPVPEGQVTDNLIHISNARITLAEGSERSFVNDTLAGLLAALEAKDTEILGWRECALYDACMDGPKFRAWDRSALDRMRRKAEEAIKNTPFMKGNTS